MGLKNQQPGKYVAEIEGLGGSVPERLRLSAAICRRALADVTPPPKGAHGDYPAVYETLTQLVHRVEWAAARWDRRWWQFWRW